MTVWIVCDTYDFEGYGAPLAVFSREEDAREFAGEVMQQEFPPDKAVVFDRVLDFKPQID